MKTLACRQLPSVRILNEKTTTLSPRQSMPSVAGCWRKTIGIAFSIQNARISGFRLEFLIVTTKKIESRKHLAGFLLYAKAVAKYEAALWSHVEKQIYYA